MQDRPEMLRTSSYPQLELLEPRLLLSGNVLISEFMASNDSTLADGYGEYRDWIELQNVSNSDVDLTDWKFLAGEPEEEPDEWVFPEVTLPANAYLVVFASDLNTQDPLGYWHTNFKLTSNGEHLALLDDTGALVHQYAPKFPEQLEDVSYGVLYE